MLVVVVEEERCAGEIIFSTYLGRSARREKGHTRRCRADPEGRESHLVAGRRWRTETATDLTVWDDRPWRRQMTRPPGVFDVPCRRDP